MRFILRLFCLSIFLVGCGEENNMPTCEFTYFKSKNIELPKYFYKKNIEISSDILRIVDGNGNVAKCFKKHDKPGVMDSVWYETITIYYPEIYEILKFGGNENNLLIYSAVGGIKAKKNYCYGYAKQGEIRLTNNRITSIDIELDFVGKENRRSFCKKQFGETLLHKTT